MENSTQITGLILAGGRSRRMGFEKSAIEVNGITQAEHLISLLERFTSGVLLSVGYRSHHFLKNAGFEVIEDETADQGPLAGVVEGHKRFPASSLLVVATDFFGITCDFLTTLLRVHAQQTVDTPHITALEQKRSGIGEPLLALSNPSALNLAASFFARGERRPSRIMEMARLSLISRDVWDIENINTKQELAAYAVAHEGSLRLPAENKTQSRGVSL